MLPFQGLGNIAEQGRGWATMQRGGSGSATLRNRGRGWTTQRKGGGAGAGQLSPSKAVSIELLENIENIPFPKMPEIAFRSFKICHCALFPPPSQPIPRYPYEQVFVRAGKCIRSEQRRKKAKLLYDLQGKYIYTIKLKTHKLKQSSLPHPESR